MKVRLGFISNSSSASYIVELNITEDRLYEILHIIDWQAEATSVVSRLVYLRESIEDQYHFGLAATLRNDMPRDKAIEAKQNHEKKVEEIDKKIDKYRKPNITKKEIAKEYLKAHEITVTPKKDSVELSAFTSMHNEYVTGMNDILKEIVLFLTFAKESNPKTKDIEIKCSVEHDG